MSQCGAAGAQSFTWGEFAMTIIQDMPVAPDLDNEITRQDGLETRGRWLIVGAYVVMMATVVVTLDYIGAQGPIWGILPALLGVGTLTAGLYGENWLRIFVGLVILAFAATTLAIIHPIFAFAGVSLVMCMGAGIVGYFDLRAAQR
jgi:hypothetical protein